MALRRDTSVTIRMIGVKPTEERPSTIDERKEEVRRLTASGAIVKHDAAFNILSVTKPTNLVLFVRHSMIRPYEAEPVERYGTTVARAEGQGGSDVGYDKIRGGSADQHIVTDIQVRASKWVEYVRRYTPEWSMQIVESVLLAQASSHWRSRVESITGEKSNVGQAAAVRMACLNIGWSSRVATQLLKT